MCGIRGKRTAGTSCLPELSLLTPVFLPANQPPGSVPLTCHLGTFKAPRASHPAQAQLASHQRLWFQQPRAGFCLVMWFHLAQGEEGSWPRGFRAVLHHATPWAPHPGPREAVSEAGAPSWQLPSTCTRTQESQRVLGTPLCRVLAAALLGAEPKAYFILLYFARGL